MVHVIVTSKRYVTKTSPRSFLPDFATSRTTFTFNVFVLLFIVYITLAVYY